MFATHVLCDAVVLVCHGLPMPGIATDGSELCRFDFPDLDDAQARSILHSPDAEVMRRFHSAWRSLRRRMQVTAETARASR